jgi:cellulose synthase/poly-beta-1,6-N-acetylglucosamine synthase-like glycosyltransferase
MIRTVAVVVPAADEQDRIESCLWAIERARRQLLASRAGVERVEVFVVLDGCQDDTSSVVETVAAFAGGIHLVNCDARCVGTARQLGALRAIELLAPPLASPSQLWLANTDADSEVPPNWLTHMVAEAESGAHLVLGTVRPGVELPRALQEIWLARHQLTRDHPHVHGANLGIRADTHLALGGWQPIRFDEDVDLVSRAQARHGVQIARTATAPVVTSARVVGRAPQGFSSYLRRLHEHRSDAELVPSEGGSDATASVEQET